MIEELLAHPRLHGLRAVTLATLDAHVAETQAAMTANGALLVHAAALAGTDAKAVHWADVPAKWFPYFFTCNEGTCEGYSATW